MGFTIREHAVPLRVDSSEAVRVGKTRVMLDIVVTAFRMGYSAEEIVNQYPTLDLADVYTVLGYYLRNQAEIDTYLLENERKAEVYRKQVEERQGSQDELHKRLLARRELMQL